MGAAIDGAVRAGSPQEDSGLHDAESFEAAQERYDEAEEALRKARKPLLKASEDLATFNTALAAAILSGQMSTEQKDEAVEARAALAVPFGARVTRFVSAHRRLVLAQRALAAAEKVAGLGDELDDEP
jgi:hypothetical protein